MTIVSKGRHVRPCTGTDNGPEHNPTGAQSVEELVLMVKHAHGVISAQSKNLNMNFNVWYILVITFPNSNAFCESDYSLSTSTFGFFQTCRSSHIKQALQKNIMCKPSPVIVALPWPNNTDVQQVIRNLRRKSDA